MRLKQIKLAGFKSFADPATITLPGNFCSIVGPNGGGKSNIVDAVRWVMGESSAKQLRGQNLTDVVFHGCRTRPMAGVASIELIFENADGRIGGEYAAYGEVAIRRQVSRDSQSSYFLNGTRCRRRDVADIFLGTGFGPRGYSIIEQGTISQLAKARPEELREYLEEAAGISKYRERRRDTENCIRHTRENLDRSGDTREELGRTLERLQRQARDAERYKELQGEVRRCTAELYAIRHVNVSGRLESLVKGLRRKEANVERLRSNLRAVETKITEVRVAHDEANERFRHEQSGFYEVREAIARIEQTLQLDRARVANLTEELESLRARAEETERRLGADQNDINDLQAAVAELQPRVVAAQAADAEAAGRLKQVEQSYAAWQEDWDALTAQSAEMDRSAQKQASRIEHAEALLVGFVERLERLAGEEGVPSPEEVGRVDRLAAEITAHQVRRSALEADVAQCRSEISSVRENILHREAELDRTQQDVQSLREDMATQRASQEAALGRAEGGIGDWLSDHGLADSARLGETLSVVPGWERAVEMALGDFLQGLVVDNIERFESLLPTLQQGRLALVETGIETTSGGELPCLGSLIRSSDGQLGSLLQGVFAAESDAVALAGRVKLKPGESIVTRSGLWVGPDWLRKQPAEDTAVGIIARTQDLEVLELRVEEAESAIARHQAGLEDTRETLRALEQKRESLQQQAEATGDALAKLKTDHGVQEVQLATAEAERGRLRRERADLERQIGLQREELANAQAGLAAAERAAEAQAPAHRALTETKDQLRGELERARQAARSRHDEFHALDMDRQGHIARLDAIRMARQRLAEQAEDFGGRGEALAQEIANASARLPDLQAELDAKLAEQQVAEKRQRTIRGRCDELGEQIRQLELARNGAAAAVDEARSELETGRVDRQGLLVEQANIQEKVEATGHELQGILNDLPGDASEEIWEQRLDRLDRSIRRLEPVNLAAIEEYDVESERKAWLDAHHDDLDRALETLRGVIRKIDAETRSRFKETFNAVNGHLAEVFPKLFGGGQAELAMTGDDLLDTGVAVLARPPGKRNASVHQLSGGEQALTAVALIFAIFRLNPSPVCVLDEIDAPLDDANVERVAQLVREMSEGVQFIVITHNKLTMEMADHLIGVTMGEPGVSRLVSVDIDEAAAMAVSA